MFNSSLLDSKLSIMMFGEILRMIPSTLITLMLSLFFEIVLLMLGPSKESLLIRALVGDFSRD